MFVAIFKITPVAILIINPFQVHTYLGYNTTVISLSIVGLKY